MCSISRWDRGRWGFQDQIKGILFYNEVMGKVYKDFFFVSFFSVGLGVKVSGGVVRPVCPSERVPTCVKWFLLTSGYWLLEDLG